MLKKILGLFRDEPASTPTLRIPAVGDPVWWAPKEIGCIVTSIEPNGNFVFQGGEVVKNKKGRVTPRWTVAAGFATARWDDETQMWVVGQGAAPRNVRGVVVTPSPAQLSGQAQGSFAPNRKN